jgi:hypothetical protein
VVVCEVADCDEVEAVPEADDDEGVAVVALVAAESSSLSLRSLLSPVEPLEVAFTLFVLEAAVWVVVALCPSCQAMAPPSDSIAATLSAAAALRARAALGLRRGRPERAVVGVGVCSSMTAKLRTPRERSNRGG